MTTYPGEVIIVDAVGADPRTVDRRLNDAEAAARERAMRDGSRGILITQHDYTSFTVSLSEDVPFGLTRESREWLGTPAAGLRTEPANLSSPLPPDEHDHTAVLTHMAWAGWAYECSPEEAPHR